MAKIVCTSCGYVGDPTNFTKGSFAIEVILWICFIIPGVIYSFWRLSSRNEVCPSCQKDTIIPSDSPIGKKFISDNVPEQLLAPSEPYRPPSKAAYSAGKTLGKVVGKIFRLGKS